MEVLTAVSTAVVAVIVFGLVSLVCTFPGWLWGKIKARQNRDLRANFLVATKARRWTLWTLSSITAVVALNFQYREAGAVAALVLISASALAQYAAFTIGYVSTVVALDRNDLESGRPQIIPGMVEDFTDEPQAIPGTDQGFPSGDYAPPARHDIPDDLPAAPNPTSVEEGLRLVEQQGYSRPEPRET